MKTNPTIVTLKNNITVTIRSAVKADAEAVLEAGWSYLSESPYLITSVNEFNYTRQQEQAWIRSLTEPRNSLLLVAAYNTKIIGTLSLTGEARSKIKHNTVLGIALRKDWQQVGLGTALLSKAIQRAKLEGTIKTIWLHVHATNTKAINLYLKMGFTQTGCLKNYILEPDGSFTDNIIMGLEI